jgi:hypothetical protein
VAYARFVAALAHCNAKLSTTAWPYVDVEIRPRHETARHRKAIEPPTHEA